MVSPSPSGIAELKIDGVYYGGWKGLRVTRSIEQIAGSFELEVTERWSPEPGTIETFRPIKAGAACQVLLDGEPVITGYVDTVDPSYDASSHGIRVTGRDKTGDLVDCSAIYKSGQWHNVKIDQLARDLLAPFGIKVLVETDVGDAFPSFGIQPGETVFGCLERAARMKALLLVSNPLGDLVITRAGKTVIPVTLEEGINIKAAHGTFSWKDRFSSYTVKGQVKGSDDFSGENAAQASANFPDQVVTRYRPLVVLAEEHGHGATLRDRAEWEANVRMGRGNRGSVTVQGWRNATGALWQPNTLIRARSPKLWLDAEMLIVGCTWSLDERGTLTELSIARREAFELVEGIGRSKLGQKLNDKEQKEKKKKGDDWSML